MYDRRAIFLRAHQLRILNRRTAKEKFDATGFGQWLRMAWSEAKAGMLPSFSPEAVRAREIEALERAIEGIEYRDRFVPADRMRLAGLRRELLRKQLEHSIASSI